MGLTRRLVLLFPLLVAVGLACGSDDGSPTVASSGSPAKENEMQEGALPGCGDQVAGWGTQTGPLAMTGRFPSRVDRAGDGTFAGNVTVAAAGQHVTGTTSPEADVYLTRSGTIVATPLAKDLIGVAVDLKPGSSQEFTARGAIRQCVKNGGLAEAGGAVLPAGRYEVFAVVTITVDAGKSMVVTGGPWPLEVT